MATEQNNRDVAKKPISKSFRGILRVSPADDGSDTGIGLTPVPVADSMGNNSALSIGTEHIEVQKEIVSQTQLRDKITFGTQTNVPTVAPAKNNILIGDNAGNYEHQDLIEIIKQFVTDNQIMEQTVPVGTVIPVAIAQKDLNLLPQRFRDYYDFADGQNRHSLTGQEYNFDNFPDLYRMVVGTSRLSYKRLRLSLPIIAASLFHENNITALTKLEINSLQAQGDLDFELVKNELQLSNIEFNTTDTFENPPVKISWQQTGRIINYEQSIGQATHAEYVYLPAGTVVQIQGARYTFGGNSYTLSAYIYDKEKLNLSTFGVDGSPLIDTVDSRSYSIPKDGIYCLIIPATLEKFTFQQLPKINVTVPEMECTIDTTYSSSAKTYVELSEDYANYILYCPEEVTNTAQFTSDQYTFNFNTITSANLDVWQSWNPDNEGIKRHLYLVLEGTSLPYNDVPLVLEGILTTNIASFNINRSGESAYDYEPSLYLKKGTVITAQGLGIISSGVRTPLPVTIYTNGNSTLLATINEQNTYTIQNDGYYNIHVPSKWWLNFDSNPWRIPFLRLSQGLTSITFNTTAYPVTSHLTVIGASGQFNLPDLRNRFIRGASTTSSTITSEGTYTIPAHAPLNIEDPQTNPYVLSSLSGEGSTKSTFKTCVRSQNYGGGALYVGGTGAFTQTYVSQASALSHYRNDHWTFANAQYELDLSNLVGPITAKETRPYNISLSYLIKVK
jgi:hypothetical protein